MFVSCYSDNAFAWRGIREGRKHVLSEKSAHLRRSGRSAPIYGHASCIRTFVPKPVRRSFSYEGSPQTPQLSVLVLSASFVVMGVASGARKLNVFADACNRFRACMVSSRRSGL